MPVKLKGQEVASALKEWIALDIKETPTRIFQVARFLFGVSATSIALMVSLSTFLFEDWGVYQFVGLVFFFAACGVALRLAMPAFIMLDGHTELETAHTAIVSKARNFMIVWGICWVLAVVSFVLPKFEEFRHALIHNRSCTAFIGG